MLYFIALVLTSLTITTTIGTNAFGQTGYPNFTGNRQYSLFSDRPTPTDNATIARGVSQHVDSIGTTHLIGEVRNTGPTEIKFAQVIATVYNANYQTVGTSYTFTNPKDIPAGESAPFDLMLQPTDLNGATAIKLHLDFQE